jgi:hypothetical protein
MAKRSSSSARPLTRHDEIRQWVEERGGKPACVRGTGGGEDVGMIRVDFPGYSGENSLEEISWDEWFEKFDDSNLALLVQEKTANGERSNFNKLVSRENAGARQSAGRGRRKTSARGQRVNARSSVRAAGRSSRAKASSRSQGSRSSSSRSRRSEGSRATSRKSASATSRKPARSTRATGRTAGNKRGSGRRAA